METTPAWPPQLEAIKKNYDKQMYDPLIDEFYGQSDFHNLGYWDDNTADQKDACENLLERLLDRIPDKKGKILDVACGKGATTRYLLKYYAPAAITGINISEKQIESCKRNAAGCVFLTMDATRMRFADRTFDNIISVEAAFHFDTREKFLKEAWRVLKPGGKLVISDIITAKPKNESRRRQLIPAANHLSSVEEYKMLWGRAGFQDVDALDVTKNASISYNNKLLEFLRGKLESGAIDAARFRRIQHIIQLSRRKEARYVLAHGTRG